ncbi:hypothetical protein [Paenibacillus sp. FSL R7-277]|uniref:hypothetical protein n=1 Tax=Paenibacillus sp. FSL R7-277 TaxID=1227352 RepID=UPI0004BB2C01|nr:hypothetical protein [Paenibacillus sp. FSL R7-277]
MNDRLVRASSSAVTMVGKPEQIMAVMAGWMKQYGRDMPLAYILLLQSDSRIKASKAG